MNTLCIQGYHLGRKMSTSSLSSDYSSAKSSLKATSIHEATLFDDITEVERGLGLFLDNKLQEAEHLLKAKAADSLYHGLGLSAITFLKSLMTFEPEDSKNALETMNITLALANRCRRREGLFNSIFGGRGSFDKWSLVERHAELIYAETIIMKALISILSDESGIYVMIKEALNIRSAHSIYKEAKKFLDENPQLVCDNLEEFEEGQIDPHFVTGVTLGIGLFNLLISLMPPRVIRLVEFAGFSGNQMIGLGLIVYGSKAKGIRSEFCKLATLFYDTMLSTYFDVIATDLDRSKVLLDEALHKYPNSLFYRFFKGRHLITCKELDAANEILESALACNTDWSRLKHILCWELSLTSLYRLDFDSSLAHATTLFNENNWSKAFYAYLEAILLFRENPQNPLVSLKFSAVGGFLKKIAGKSIPLEKYVARKSRKFTAQNRLCLPHLEIVMIFNGFRNMDDNRLYESLQLIDEEKKLWPSLPSSSRTVDDECLVLLLEAIIHSQLNSADIESRFDAFFEKSANITLDHFYIPFACLEAARFYNKQGDDVKAKSFIDKGFKMNGYSLENMLTSRLHNCRHLIEKEDKSVESK